VWTSQNSTISDSNIIALEALLQTKSEIDLPDMRSEGVEPIYWAGTESGLIDIYNFPGVIYTTDGSKGSTGMGAGFDRHYTKGDGCCRVGGGVGGGSSGRAEFAAACLALEDSLTHDQPIAPRHSPDGDILARIIQVLHQRVSMGLFTMFIKIRAHRGEFLNEKADRWADKGREDIYNVRWDGPSLPLTFSWIEEGVKHKCSMNKILRTRVHLKVSELQLPLHKNYTSEILN